MTESVFRLNSSSFSVKVDQIELTFTEKDVKKIVEFEDPYLCQSWTRYIQSARLRMVSLLQETLENR